METKQPKSQKKSFENPKKLAFLVILIIIIASVILSGVFLFYYFTATTVQTITIKPSLEINEGDLTVIKKYQSFGPPLNTNQVVGRSDPFKPYY